MQNSQEHWMHHVTFCSCNKLQPVNGSAFRKLLGVVVLGSPIWVYLGSSVLTFFSQCLTLTNGSILILSNSQFLKPLDWDKNQSVPCSSIPWFDFSHFPSSWESVVLCWDLRAVATSLHLWTSVPYFWPHSLSNSLHQSFLFPAKH